VGLVRDCAILRAMTITISPAAERDLPAVASFARWTYEKAFGDGFAPEDLAHHLTHRLSDHYFRDAATRDRFLIASVDGQMAGYVQFGPGDGKSADSPHRHIVRLYVHPDRQGQGIGSALLNAALADESMASANAIYLDVWDRNEGACRLYERFGFEVVGAHNFMTPSGIVLGHELVMALHRQI
jgi:ribosomal protein S18 acetylase RimI-like enzyme